MKKATIADVAKAAGVSTYTVSRALRGLEHVNEETRKKVLSAAHELNFIASPTAAALATGRTNRIALLVRESLSGWFVGEIAEGIYDVLFPRKYDLILYRAANEEERDEFFRRSPANRNADALLIAGFGPNESERNTLAKLDLPIVSINAVHAEYAQASVSIDDVDGEKSAVRYLAVLGHKRFVYIGKPNLNPTWGPDERINGYLQAINELNLDNRGTYTFNATDARGVSGLVAQILALPQPPTALCVWSDMYALKIVHELRRINIPCPGKISVIGFDGQTAAQEAGLTSVSQPAREIGAIAAQLALKLIDGQPIKNKHITLPTTVVPMETTGIVSPTAEE